MLRLTTKLRLINRQIRFSTSKPNFYKDIKVDSDQQWPFVDLFDKQQEIKIFQQKNKRLKEYKLSGKQNNLLQDQLKKVLGKNFQRYDETNYEIKNTDIGIVEWACLKNQLGRFFQKIEDLVKMAKYEAPNKVEEEENYKHKNLSEIYKPTDFCSQLLDNQIILFNIPLDVDESDIKVYLQEKGYEVELENIKISTCLLNLNSFATISFKSGDITQIKASLDRQNFKDAVLDVKTKEDSESEHPFNRTIAITNLDQNWNFMKVLQHIGEFGRVQNMVLPEKMGLQWQLEEDLISSLDPNQPCQIEITHVTSGFKETIMWPSEDQYLKFMKVEYPEEDYNPISQNQSVLQYQKKIKNYEYWKRQYRMFTEKRYKCLRVPEHLKQEFRQAIKNKESKFSRYYDQYYQNRGFCVVTFSSRTMAQRALYAINQLTSMDLSQVPIKLKNQPQFFDDIDLSHSKMEKYGGKFLIENYTQGSHLQRMMAFKSWESMELYHLDNEFNYKQLEKIRQNYGNLREQTKERIQQIKVKEMVDNDNIKERTEKIKNLVFEDLKKINVENLAFSKHENQFKVEGNEPISKLNPGRQFDNTLDHYQFQGQLKRLSEMAEKVQAPDIDLAQRIMNKYMDNLFSNDSQRELMKEKDKLALGDNGMINMMRQRMLQDAIQSNEGRHIQFLEDKQIIEKLEKTVGRKKRISFLQFRQDAKKQQQQQELLVRQQRDEAKQLDDTPKESFSTISDIKRIEIKYQNHLQMLENVLYGNYNEQQKEELFSINEVVDALNYNLNYAKDRDGNKYLNDDIIYFDVDKEQYDEWVNNRKQLLMLIPDEYLNELKQNGEKNYTKELIDFYENGYPTETYKLKDDQDGDEIEQQLNQYVAGNGERYFYVKDERTKEKFIVKSEKTFYKYDLSVISQFEQNMQEDIKMIMEQFNYSYDEAVQIIKDMREFGKLPDKIREFYEKTQEELRKQDIEQLCNELKISRKEMEYHLNNQIHKEYEFYRQEMQEQLERESIRLKHGEKRSDSYVRDSKHNIRLKGADGEFKVPKYRKY